MAVTTWLRWSLTGPVLAGVVLAAAWGRPAGMALFAAFLFLAVVP